MVRSALPSGRRHPRCRGDGRVGRRMGGGDGWHPGPGPALGRSGLVGECQSEVVRTSQHLDRVAYQRVGRRGDIPRRSGSGRVPLERARLARGGGARGRVLRHAGHAVEQRRWAAGAGGLYRWSGSMWSPILSDRAGSRSEPAFDHAAVSAAGTDKVWLGSWNDGIYHWNGQGWRHFEDPPAVTALAIGRGLNLGLGGGPTERRTLTLDRRGLGQGGPSGRQSPGPSWPQPLVGSGQ